MRRDVLLREAISLVVQSVASCVRRGLLAAKRGRRNLLVRRFPSPLKYSRCTSGGEQLAKQKVMYRLLWRPMFPWMLSVFSVYKLLAALTSMSIGVGVNSPPRGRQLSPA
jgi:hypothetical protein